MKELNDKIFEKCCDVAEFLMRPIVRWAIRFATGAGLTVGVFLLARAWLNGTISFLGGLPIAILMTVVGCIGLKED